MLSLYNTLTKKIEPFKPLSENKIKFYACGPTVYNYAQIGNLCCYVFDDIVIRSLQFLGYEVDALMNLTDIDDKTIRDSQKSGKKLKEFTELYTKLFFQDLEKLNIQSFPRRKPISELVPEMIDMTQKLINSKHAYISDDGSVYFDIKSFKEYGKLAHIDMKWMKTWIRVKLDEYEKENISDFALWKWYDTNDGENFWNATFIKPETQEKIILKWRPGWHIECSACNMWWHGEQIDIHMGWIDLIFPHHQNEIAQTEWITWKKFCNYWMHTGHLLVDGKKMGKSLWNYYFLYNLEEKYPDKKELLYRAFRMMCLQNKYRENFNFTFERLEGAMTTVIGIDNFLKRLKTYTSKNTKISREFRTYIQESMQKFVQCLESDIDTVNALTEVFALVTKVNRDMDTSTLWIKEVWAVTDILKNWDMVLGLVDWSLLESIDIPEDITDLAQKRIEAKKNKDFKLADSIRNTIESSGYTLIDTKEWFLIEKK